MSVIDQYAEARLEGQPYFEKPLSRITVNRMRRGLENVENFVGKPLLEFTRQDALKSLQVVGGYKSETDRHTMLNALRSFYEWAIEMGLTENPNPFWFIGRSDKNPHLVDRLSWNQLVHTFITAPEAFTNKHDGKTVQLVIGLMGLAGMRIEEVLELQKDDVRNDGIVVRRDGRFVPLSRELYFLMHDVIEGNPPTSNYVIRGLSGMIRDNEPLSPGPVNVKINTVLDKVGVDRSNIKPLSLRETFVDRAAKLIDDPTMLYTLVGHSRVNRQPSIPFFNDEEIKEAYRKIVN